VHHLSRDLIDFEVGSDNFNMAACVTAASSATEHNSPIHSEGPLCSPGLVITENPVANSVLHRTNTSNISAALMFGFTTLPAWIAKAIQEEEGA
jgi:hypothetical protein